MEYLLKAVRVNKIIMKTLTSIVFSIILTSCSYSQSNNNLSNEDYVVLNVFLEQTTSFTYLDLSIKNSKNESDSLTLINAYNRKLKLYHSFNNLCLKNLETNDTLNYETNLSCSIAEKFKIYENLFSKEEWLTFSNLLSKGKKKSFLIDSEKLQISTIKPLTKEAKSNDEIIKIYTICYNKEKNKALIKYSINNRHLYSVLRKENGWWKSVINFDL